jgi:hypothetical protein
LPLAVLQDNQLYDAWYRLACERAFRAADCLAGGSPSAENEPAAVAEAMIRARSRHPMTVHWARRVARSSEWLSESIERHCDDPRLHQLCSASLRSHLAGDGTRVPVAAIGLAPCLAKSYFWPGSDRPRTWGVRVRRVRARLVSLLRAGS